jgi:hypothetical protein
LEWYGRQESQVNGHRKTVVLSLKFLGSFPLQPIPKNEGYDNQDEKKGNVAAMKGLRCEVKREDP